jgi:hypothetical protein
MAIPIAINVLGTALAIAIVLWTTPHPRPLHPAENYAINGLMLVGDIMEPVLAAAIDNPAFEPIPGTFDPFEGSVAPIAAEVLPAAPPPPPGPPLPVGLQLPPVSPGLPPG